MKIIIQIKKRKIQIRLLAEENVKDREDIKDEFGLSEKLLPKIEKMLERNGLDRNDIKEVKIDSDQSDNFTTTRIAKSVANIWSYAI